MTDSKLIAIWGIENVITSYLKTFLAVKEDWQIVHVSNKKELEASIQAVKSTQPDIVLIGQGYYNSSSNLPLHVIRNHPEIKVIVICLDRNVLEVNNQQEILIKHPSDLIAVIENEPASLGGLAYLGS